MNTILITGANRGIGLALVQTYLKAGWRVLACCRVPDRADELNKLCNEKPDNLKLLSFDATDREQIEKLGQELSTEKIDILFNNAGVIAVAHENIDNADTNKWLEAFKVNTIAPFLLTKALLLQIKNSEKKLVVNMSTSLGSITQMTTGGYYGYRATKAGLNAVTKALANDLKSHHITVIALHPGWVRTDMGGDKAPLSPEKCAESIMASLSTVTLDESGTFITYQGENLPW